MGLFDDVLTSRQTLFKDEIALDYDYLPKMLPYRENQQHFAAECIKPLFGKRTGRNLFVYGSPGIGKTAAIRWVLRELEEKADDIYPIYVNCWQKNTTYKIYLDICEQLNYKFVQNKNTEELFAIIEELVNKESAVFVFDEIDKLKDYDFLYSILEKVFKKTVILITNFKEWYTNLDVRIRSRLTTEMLEFKAYSEQETEGIIKQRAGFAFVAGAWNDDALTMVAKKTFSVKDLRQGLYLLKESALLAEERASKLIMPIDVNKAIEKMDKFTIKNTLDLQDENKFILDIIKEKQKAKIGDMFRTYQEKGGKAVYKTFQRKIAELAEAKFISTEKVIGKDGNTTLVSIKKEKGLDEFS